MKIYTTYPIVPQPLLPIVGFFHSSTEYDADEIANAKHRWLYQHPCVVPGSAVTFNAIYEFDDNDAPGYIGDMFAGRKITRVRVETVNGVAQWVVETETGETMSDLEIEQRNELCRKGKLFCPVCGKAMRMNFRPFCPMCTGIAPAGQYYNYLDAQAYIEAKYGISDDALWDMLVEDYEVTNRSQLSIDWYGMAENCRRHEALPFLTKLAEEFGEGTFNILFSW